MCASTAACDPELVKSVLSDFVFPIIVGILAFVASNIVSSRQTRKRHSLLGAAVIDSLIEEITNGIAILEYIKAMMSGSGRTIGNMPRKSWSGMLTISDDILERILCVSEGKTTDGFPAKEVRIHLKNYFDHMCPNIDSVISSMQSGGQWQPIAQLYLGSGDYIAAANGVLAMLKCIKRLLEANYRSWFPK